MKIFKTQSQVICDAYQLQFLLWSCKLQKAPTLSPVYGWSLVKWVPTQEWALYD